MCDSQSPEGQNLSQDEKIDNLIRWVSTILDEASEEVPRSGQPSLERQVSALLQDADEAREREYSKLEELLMAVPEGLYETSWVKEMCAEGNRLLREQREDDALKVLGQYADSLAGDTSLQGYAAQAAAGVLLRNWQDALADGCPDNLVADVDEVIARLTAFKRKAIQVLPAKNGGLQGLPAEVWKKAMEENCGASFEEARNPDTCFIWRRKGSALAYSGKAASEIEVVAKAIQALYAKD